MKKFCIGRDTLITASLAALSLIILSPARGQNAMKTTSYQTLPAEGGNAAYQGNRTPLLPSPLVKLPVGAVRPQGWLLRQLELMRDGFTGHLTEISKWCKIEGNAWVSSHGEGEYGWEEVPYWLKGYIDLGYVLHDKRIIDESERWINGVLSSQDSSGYFGPRRNEQTPDIWPNMVMLSALRTHFEGTGDPRVIPFMSRYAHWLNTVEIDRYLPESWQKWRGGDNLDHLYWLYNRTGDAWVLDLARLNHERTADWTGGIPTWHGVNLCQGFREPAEYYQQSGDIQYLHATERNYDTIIGMYGQVPGGMFGADENARPGYTGPRQAAETCSMVEFMNSDEMLVGITGDPLWADRGEDVAFNSLPASMTPGLKGLHYLTAPNMVQLDRRGKGTMFDNDGDMLSYNPWQYRCCQHNVAFGWPYLAEHLFMATAGNGLAAVFYAPGTVTAKVGSGTEVTVTETTSYPFGDRIDFTFSQKQDVAFPLALRIPGWCANATITVNGKPVDAKPGPRSWCMIERTWKNGDVVRLVLPAAVAVQVWKNNKNAISVYRGPLAYSLKIGERWEKYGDSPAWPGYEVYPTTPWNYGLIVDLKQPAKAFEVVERSGSFPGQPFTPDAAPVELRVRAKKIPQWRQESNGMVGDLQLSPVHSDEPMETVTLIPMGCARLRISSFPRVSDSPEANIWD